jgi:hypothetical protein
MRLIILLVAILLFCSLIGWITFSKGPGHSSVNIETDQIRADTDRALQSGAEVLRSAGEEIDHRAAQKIEPAPTVENESAPVNR